ncbi:MAG: hypothetical protein JWO03_419 [Bacteroidetes bacterium]|nr:hypothetical protein [Bacteroidota bacterium]
MKKTFLLCALIFTCCLPAICQSHNKTNISYDYALLHIVDDEDMYMVQYNNASKEVSLWDTLKIDRDKESLSQAKIKCFQYLNKMGYELVSSSSYPFKISHKEDEVKYEYVFRREQERF